MLREFTRVNIQPLNTLCEWAVLLTAVLGSASDGFEVCALTSDPGYVIYSACGSFWVPMIIMMMFYARIYRTASRASAAVRRGFIPAGDVHASSSSSSSRFFGHSRSLTPSRSESCIALRVHRGGRDCRSTARQTVENWVCPDRMLLFAPTMPILAAMVSYLWSIMSF